MNYENSKSLTDVKFKRLVGVQRKTFAQMLQMLNLAYAQTHKQGWAYAQIVIGGFTNGYFTVSTRIPHLRTDCS